VTERLPDLDPVQERFRAYLDDEMSPEERRLFDAELDANAALAGEFNLYRQTVELLRRVGPTTAPESLLPAIQKRLAGRHMRENYGATIRFPYEVMAFVIMLGCVFYLYFTQVPTGPGAISPKVRPQLVEIELSRPLSRDLEASFGLEVLATDRPFERTVFGTYPRSRAQELFAALAPSRVSPQEFPQGEAHSCTLVLTSPVK
jgi:hypothetical protein